MRIAVWHNLPSGGGKRALHDHLHGLSTRGHHLEIWCPDTADLSYQPLSPFGAEHVIPLEGIPDSSKRRGLFAKRLFKAHEAAQLSQSLNVHCRKVAEEISGRGFDLLFANSCQISGSSPIGRHVSIPSVLYLQEPKRFLYEAGPRPPFAAASSSELRALPLLHRIRAFVDDYIVVSGMRQHIRDEVANASSFDMILVNSYYSRESVLSAYGLDSRVCYLGVNHNQFAVGAYPRGNYALGLGSIRREKGVDFAIEAMALVTEPRLPLVWIGNSVDPEYTSAMKALAQTRGVEFEPRVMVGDGELQELLQNALMMIYSPRLEPFGLAPLEANACGTPVVAIAEGGVRETVIDGWNGIVVPAEPRAAAAAIDKLVLNPELARSLGENGRNNVEKNWSAEAAVDRIESCFLDALSNANRTS